MQLQSAKPNPSLGRWIHSFRQYTFTTEDHAYFTSLPGTGAELWLLNAGRLSLANQPLGDGLLCLRSRQFEFRQAGLRIFSIRFRAGSLPFFAQRPLTELVDHFTPLDRQWDTASVRQLSQMHRSPYFAEQCLLAERFLLSHLSAGARLEPMQQLASVMYEQSADFALTDYAEQLQRNRSYLSRQFHQIQGTSAKQFHRLCRFERFLREALFATKPSLARLALDHGYYDQAHMQHEVLQLSQRSPGQLLAKEAMRLFYSPRNSPKNTRD